MLGLNIVEVHYYLCTCKIYSMRKKIKNVPLQNILDKSCRPNVVEIPNEPWPGHMSVHPVEQQYESDRQPNMVTRNMGSISNIPKFP